MSNLGVNIDQVWQQPSLVADHAPPRKTNRYAVPIDPSQFATQYGGGGNGGGYGGGNGGGYGSGGDQHPQSQNPPSYYRQDYYEQFTGNGKNTSDSQEQPMLGAGMNQNTHHPPPALGPIHTSSMPPDAGSGSNAGPESQAIAECQRDMVYMKSIIQQLKRELFESRARQMQLHELHREQQRPKPAQVIFCVCLVVLLIVAIVMILQLSSRINRLVSQQIM